MNREFAFPGTRARFAPDRVIDIQHVALELEVDPGSRTVAGTATLRANLIARDARSVELDAVELSIESVTVNDKAAAFRHDGKKLRVELASDQAELVIAVRYRGAPRRGLYFVAPEDGYPHKPV